jgi:hypothetical protein
MAVFLSLIIALATAIVLIADAGGARPHAPGATAHTSVAARLRAGIEDAGVEVVYDEDPSPILEAVVIEPAAAGIPRIALARLVGSIAVSGLVIGLAIVLAAKVLGALLKHFAAGS